MEIKEGEYIIPNGYSIKRVGNHLSVYKTKANKLQEGEYRCKDCVHYVKGYSLNSGWYETIICNDKPKRMSKDGRMLYRAAHKYGKPCDSFKLREEDV